jgi:hypothetical protein
MNGFRDNSSESLVSWGRTAFYNQNFHGSAGQCKIDAFPHYVNPEVQKRALQFGTLGKFLLHWVKFDIKSQCLTLTALHEQPN